MSLTPRIPCCGLAFASLVACGGPGTEAFDPVATSQKAQEAFARVTNSPAIQNFTAIQGAFTWSGAPPVHPVLGAPAAPADILPPGTAGKTYTYSTSSGKYAGNLDAAVPATTARFILYEIVGGAVKVPLAPVGQLDLSNQNTPTPNALLVKATINGATLVDYRGTASLVGGAWVATANGMVSDVAKSLDFEVSQNFSAASGLRIDYKVSTPSPEITLQATAVQTGGSSSPTTVTLTATEGRNKLEVTATGSASMVNGTVQYNGTGIARITGTGDAPMFVSQGGRTLSTGEIAGLRQLFDFVDVLFDGIDEVLIPLYFVAGFHP